MKRDAKPANLQSPNEETMITLEFTRNELHAVWAACFALHARQRATLNGAANYETVTRQDAADALDRVESVIRKLNPLLHGYREIELSELLER